MPFFSSFYASTTASSGGAVEPSISSQLWTAIGDAFTGKTSTPAAIEMEEYIPGRPVIEPPEPEFPTLPKSEDLFAHITEKMPETEVIEPIDVGDFGGIQPAPRDILNEYDALNLDEVFKDAMQLNEKSAALRQTLSDIIKSPIPDAFEVLKAQRAAAKPIGENAPGFQDLYDTIYKRPVPPDFPIQTAEEKGLAAALLNNREAAIDRIFFDDKVDPWLAEPSMAEDFAAAIPIEEHGGPMEAPSIWQRMKNLVDRGGISESELAEDLAKGLEDIRGYNLLGAVTDTEKASLVAANQAVKISRAGLSGAETTEAYLASLEIGEASFLSTIRAMTWGEIAESVASGIFSLGLSLGLNFLGSWLLERAEIHKQELLKEYGFSEAAEFETWDMEYQKTHNESGSVGYFICGEIAYPMKVVEPQHKDKSYTIVFRDIFQFLQRSTVPESSVGFFYNENGKTMKNWDMPDDLRKEYVIRNTTTQKVVPSYPIIANGSLVKMRSDRTLGIVAERDFEKKMYRIRNIDGSHHWFSLPSEFWVSSDELKDIKLEKPDSIDTVMKRFGKMFPDKSDNTTKPNWEESARKYFDTTHYHAPLKKEEKPDLSKFLQDDELTALLNQIPILIKKLGFFEQTSEVSSLISELEVAKSKTDKTEIQNVINSVEEYIRSLDEFVPLYKLGQKWNYGKDKKIVIVDVPDNEVDKYSYVQLDQFSFDNDIWDLKSISESYITEWIRIGDLTKFTPFQDFSYIDPIVEEPKITPSKVPSERDHVWFQINDRWDLVGDRQTKLVIVHVDRDPELYWYVTVKEENKIWLPDTPRFSLSFADLAHYIGRTLTAYTPFGTEHVKIPEEDQKSFTPKYEKNQRWNAGESGIREWKMVLVKVPEKSGDLYAYVIVENDYDLHLQKGDYQEIDEATLDSWIRDKIITEFTPFLHNEIFQKDDADFEVTPVVKKPTKIFKSLMNRRSLMNNEAYTNPVLIWANELRYDHTYQNQKKREVKIRFWDSTIPELERAELKADSWFVPHLFDFQSTKIRCHLPYQLLGKDRCYEFLHAICSEIFGTYYKYFGQDGFLNTRSKENKTGAVPPKTLLLAFSSKDARVPLPVTMSIRTKDEKTGKTLGRKKIEFHPGKGNFIYQNVNLETNRGIHSALPFFEGLPARNKSEQLRIMKSRWNGIPFNINPKDFPGLRTSRKQYPFLNSIYFLCQSLIRANGKKMDGDLRFDHMLAFQDRFFIKLLNLSFCSIREDDLRFADEFEDEDLILRIQLLNFIIDGYTLIYHGGLSEKPNFLKYFILERNALFEEFKKRFPHQKLPKNERPKPKKRPQVKPKPAPRPPPVVPQKRPQHQPLPDSEDESENPLDTDSDEVNPAAVALPDTPVKLEPGGVEYNPEEMLKPKIAQIFENMDLTVPPNIHFAERHGIFAEKWRDLIWTNLDGLEEGRRIFAQRWSVSQNQWVDRDEYLEDNILEFFRSRLKRLFDSWNNKNSFKYRIKPIDFIQTTTQTFDGFILPSAGRGQSLDDNDLILRMAGVDPNFFGRTSRTNYSKLFNGIRFKKFYELYKVWAPTYKLEGTELPDLPPLIPEYELDDTATVATRDPSPDRPSPIESPYGRVIEPAAAVMNPQMFNTMQHDQPLDQPAEPNQLFNSLDPGLLPEDTESESEKEQKQAEVDPMERPEFIQQSPEEIAARETIPSKGYIDSARRVQSVSIFEEKAAKSWSFWLAILMFIIICWALITRRRY